jgi:signal peptide peptidase SppA
MVYAARGQKPIVAFANGMMASAAYWIGSAADEIVAEETAEIGSIGVVMMHYDYSGADEQAGVKRTILQAGHYKAMGNDTEPLSEEAEEYFQGHLDYLYTLFVDAVARNRDVTAEAVIEDMAEGRIFIGRQAVDAGLVDRLGNFETAMALVMEQAAGRQNTYFRHGAEAPQRKEKDLMKITLEALQKESPELLAQIQADARRQRALWARFEAGQKAWHAEGSPSSDEDAAWDVSSPISEAEIERWAPSLVTAP